MPGSFAYQAGSGLILDLSDPAYPVPAGNFSLLNTSENQMHQVLASEKYLLAGWFDANSGRLAHAMLAQESGTGFSGGAGRAAVAVRIGPRGGSQPIQPQDRAPFQIGRACIDSIANI